MHKEEEEASALHLCFRLFVRRGPWFVLDELYCRYYAAARRGGSDALGWMPTRTPAWTTREMGERGATWARTNN